MDRILYDEAAIKDGISRIAQAISKQPAMKPDIIIPIMNGALLLAADLLRELYPKIDPVIGILKMTRLPRVHDAGKFFVSGQVHTLNALPGGITGKRVLLLDTIFDTGETMMQAKTMLQDRHPRSVNSAVLVWRNLPDAKGKPDHFAFDRRGAVEYLYGYGMDKSGSHRGRREVCVS